MVPRTCPAVAARHLLRLIKKRKARLGGEPPRTVEAEAPAAGGVDLAGAHLAGLAGGRLVAEGCPVVGRLQGEAPKAFLVGGHLAAEGCPVVDRLQGEAPKAFLAEGHLAAEGCPVVDRLQGEAPKAFLVGGHLAAEGCPVVAHLQGEVPKAFLVKTLANPHVVLLKVANKKNENKNLVRYFLTLKQNTEIVKIHMLSLTKQTIWLFNIY